MSPKTVKAVPSLPPDYKPSAKEEYMSPQQLEYFRQKLIQWKEDILRESKQTLHHIQEETLQQPDITDRASLETDMALELRTRDHERKLIAKIDSALERIEQGEYGYCEETGQPIEDHDPHLSQSGANSVKGRLRLGRTIWETLISSTEPARNLAEPFVLELAPNPIRSGAFVAAKIALPTGPMVLLPRLVALLDPK